MLGEHLQHQRDVFGIESGVEAVQEDELWSRQKDASDAEELLLAERKHVVPVLLDIESTRSLHEILDSQHAQRAANLRVRHHGLLSGSQ